MLDVEEVREKYRGFGDHSDDDDDDNDDNGDGDKQKLLHPIGSVTRKETSSGSSATSHQSSAAQRIPLQVNLPSLPLEGNLPHKGNLPLHLVGTPVGARKM